MIHACGYGDEASYHWDASSEKNCFVFVSVKPGQSLLDIAFFESGFLNPSVCQDMIQTVDRDQAAGPVKNDSPCQRPGSGKR